MSVCQRLSECQNKQAALAQKMELARRNNNNKDSEGEEVEERTKESKETEEQDPHAEFAKLLEQSQPMKQPSTKKDGGIFSTTNSTDIATKKKKNKSNTKAKKKSPENETLDDQEKDDENDFPTLLQQGDVARRRDFEPIIEITTGQPLGPLRAAELVPWVPPFVTKYLIVLADPRRQSIELRQAIEYLRSTVASENINAARFLAIGSDDSPKAFKAQIDALVNDNEFMICLDPSLEWMTTYGCTAHFGLHLLAMDSDGIIQTTEADVSPSDVCQRVTEILQTD